jgi:glycosyltransferase involved in cell wall biosynthesis
MSTAPIVSVIVPAYNAEPFIERTLDSVLSQTYKNLEVIVVDDGSTDATREIVARIAEHDGRVHVLVQRNQGVAAARNAAIAHSRGEFVAPVDADDIWFPRKIELQLLRMEECGGETALVYCWWAGVDEDDYLTGTAARWLAEGHLADSLTFLNFIGNASVPLFRRSALEEVGGYNEHFRKEHGQGCEDWDLTLRVAERYKLAVAKAFLVGYRSVDGRMSNNWQQMAKSYDLMLADLLQRRPDVNRELIDWSRSHFYRYIAVIAYSSLQPRAALHWLTRAARIDPSVLLPVGILKLSTKALIRIAAMPVTSRIWPNVDSWRAFRKYTRFNLRKRHTINEVELFTRRSRPMWGWRNWKPHDRVMISRWRKTLDMPFQTSRA